MHSQLALTEHASLNLAPLILLDPVHMLNESVYAQYPVGDAEIGQHATWDTSFLFTSELTNYLDFRWYLPTYVLDVASCVILVT